MKKGAETTVWGFLASTMWKVTVGQRYTQVGRPKFWNGEHHIYIKELGEEVPSVFFTDQAPVA